MVGKSGPLGREFVEPSTGGPSTGSGQSEYLAINFKISDQRLQGRSKLVCSRLQRIAEKSLGSFSQSFPHAGSRPGSYTGKWAVSGGPAPVSQVVAGTAPSGSMRMGHNVSYDNSRPVRDILACLVEPGMLAESPSGSTIATQPAPNATGVNEVLHRLFRDTAGCILFGRMPLGPGLV